MRILHLYRTFFPETQGGLEEAILQIAKNTLSCGVDVRILVPTWKVPGKFIYQGIEVYTYKRHGEIASCDWSVSALSALKTQLEWADLIHLHYPWPFADLLYLFSRTKLPVIVTYHSDIVRQKKLMRLYRPLSNWLFSRVDKIISTSENYARTSAVLKRFDSKVDVIPLGMSVSGYLDKRQAEVIWKDCEIPERFVFFVGVHRYYKGLDYLIEAAKGAKFSVVIAGYGDRTEELKRVAGDNVYFVGRISDEKKYDLYKRCCAVVLPSCERSEAYGMTLVEAAMCGKAMISCELGTGTSYVNYHEETGYVVAPKSAKALRAAITRIYDNEDLSIRLGKNALKRYESLLTGRAMGGAYKDIYSATLSRSGSSGSEIKATD